MFLSQESDERAGTTACELLLREPWENAAMRSATLRGGVATAVVVVVATRGAWGPRAGPPSVLTLSRLDCLVRLAPAAGGNTEAPKATAWDAAVAEALATLCWSGTLNMATILAIPDVGLGFASS